MEEADLPEPGTHNITKLLNDSDVRSDQARQELVSKVYDQLRQIAQKRMSRERSDHTLQATALVHEAYIKMSDHMDQHEWENRGHFFAAAAQAMRRVLINHARDRKRLKRGGDQQRVAINVMDLAEDTDPDTIIALDAAVERLRQKDEHYAKLVHLRFYAGLSVDETAEIMGISKRSVIRHWNFARAWLHKEMKNAEQ
ncbi:MAG: RNA polymerase sigma factor (TIGR02999 family) [Verrucomicrobiales bacterium]|jgi:RNA polymerase sigma factor (TIGR02999 family)